MTLYNKTDTAKILAVSVITVNRLMRAGVLPYRKIGRQIRFTEADIDAFLESVRRNMPANTEEANNE